RMSTGAVHGSHRTGYADRCDGFAVAGLSAACGGRERINADCQCTRDTAFEIDVTNRTHQTHLRYDADLMEDRLAPRARYGRSVVSRSSRNRLAAGPSRYSVHARNEPPSVTSIIRASVGASVSARS